MSIPQRIVSLVPSTTESVCSFGAAAALVGCTRYCTEPAGALAGVARIGGTKNPSLEAIARLAPDLVLANAEENRVEDIEWLRQRMPVLVQTPRTVIEAAVAWRELAAALGAEDELSPFLLRIEARLAAAEVEGLGEPPLRVFYPIWRKPWMSIGSDTFVHDVLLRAGAHNVCADLAARYPQVTPEWVCDQEVEAVLLPSEPWEFGQAELEQLRAENTFGAPVMELCDGRDYCWHGVRMADGFGRVVESVARLRRAARRGPS